MGKGGRPHIAAPSGGVSRYEMEGHMENNSSWGFQEGDQIVDGRVALTRLGGGNRHEAYLAWDDRLFTAVVVKLLRPNRVADPHALSSLVHEVDMLRRLNHPLVVRAFGEVVDGPCPHIVLEHLEGPRLSTLLRKYGTLPWEQLLPLAVQMCSALHYLGTQHVVHLDVKPSNIVMDATPRLIDLSAAHTVAEALSIDHPVGTDAYMSPEQCGGPFASNISSASDIWGLGATLYEAVAGQAPFRGEARHPNERWPQLNRAAPPFSDTVPDVLAKPIMACLHRNPGERPTPAELADCLDPLLAMLPRYSVLGRLKPKFRSG